MSDYVNFTTQTVTPNFSAHNKVIMSNASHQQYRFGKYIYEYIIELDENYAPIRFSGKNKYFSISNRVFYLFREKRRGQTPVYLQSKSQILFRKFPDKKEKKVSFLSLYNLDSVSALKAAKELMEFDPEIFHTYMTHA